MRALVPSEILLLFVDLVDDEFNYEARFVGSFSSETLFLSLSL